MKFSPCSGSVRISSPRKESQGPRENWRHKGVSHRAYVELRSAAYRLRRAYAALRSAYAGLRGNTPRDAKG